MGKEYKSFISKVCAWIMAILHKIDVLHEVLVALSVTQKGICKQHAGVILSLENMSTHFAIRSPLVASTWKIILNAWCFNIFTYKNALHHITVVDRLVPQVCIISFHRDCKALQDLLDPGDCQEKLYVLCHFSSCSCGVCTVSQWSSATEVSIAAPFVGAAVAIRGWSTVGWDASLNRPLSWVSLNHLYCASDTVWQPGVDVGTGVTDMRAFTLLDYLSLVPLLALCSLGPAFPFQLGDHCLAGMVKQQVLLVCVVQLLTVPRHRCCWARLPEMWCACGCDWRVGSVKQWYFSAELECSCSHCAFGCSTFRSANWWGKVMGVSFTGILVSL